MLRLVFWLMKITIFAVLVLALGNWVQWRGKTISDQVRTRISHAEQTAGQVAENAKSWVEEKKRQAENALVNAKESSQDAIRERTQDAPERIDPSERQKLRALISELNGTQKRD